MGERGSSDCVMTRDTHEVRGTTYVIARPGAEAEKRKRRLAEVRGHMRERGMPPRKREPCLHVMEPWWYAESACQRSSMPCQVAFQEVNMDPGVHYGKAGRGEGEWIVAGKNEGEWRGRATAVKKQLGIVRHRQVVQNGLGISIATGEVLNLHLPPKIHA